METDDELREQIQDELEWDPRFDGKHIGVIVRDGIVTLTGHVDSWTDKLNIEEAVRRTKGVKAYVEDLVVRLKDKSKRSDEEIAEVALKNLKWNTNIPIGGVIVKVEDGWITLEGEVDWDYQREAAKNAVKNLIGVKGLRNDLKLRQKIRTEKLKPEDIKQKIRKSFERNAQIDAGHIVVDAEGSKIILRGSVQSWAEKKQAEKIAFFAPGVREVENKIEIDLRKAVY